MSVQPSFNRAMTTKILHSATLAFGLVFSTVLGSPAAAQLDHTQLLGFLSEPPLHARLAAADAAVIADVAAVDMGRIRLTRVVPLFGITQDDDLEVKRAPTNPPPLMPGERSLLLLKGSRPPYVLADANDDILKIAGSQMEARWNQAVKDLRAALARPDAMATSYLAWVYLSWLDQPEEDLRRAAILGLGDRNASFHPLRSNFVESLIRTASDPSMDFALRRAAAFVAGRSAADQPALVAERPQIRRDLDHLNIELRD